MERRGSGGGSLSARMRGHLAHIRACEESGETLKRYARRKGLSIHALYQAKKALRKKGVLAAGASSATKRRRGSAAKDRARRFVEAMVPIHAVATADGGAAWRVRLPGGAVLESRTPLGLDEAVRLLEVLGARS